MSQLWNTVRKVIYNTLSRLSDIVAGSRPTHSLYLDNGVYIPDLEQRHMLYVII